MRQPQPATARSAMELLRLLLGLAFMVRMAPLRVGHAPKSSPAWCNAPVRMVSLSTAIRQSVTSDPFRRRRMRQRDRP